MVIPFACKGRVHTDRCTRPSSTLDEAIRWYWTESLEGAVKSYILGSFLIRLQISGTPSREREKFPSRAAPRTRCRVCRAAAFSAAHPAGFVRIPIRIPMRASPARRREDAEPPWHKMRSNSLSQRPQFPAPPRGSGKNTQVGRRRGRGAARGDAEAALTQDAVELFEPTPYPPNFRHPLVGAGKFPSRAAPRHYRPAHRVDCC